MSRIATWVAIAVVSACHGGAGAERGPCLPAHACDPGLVCLSQLCVRPAAATPLAAPSCPEGTLPSAPESFGAVPPQPPASAARAVASSGRAVRFVLSPGPARLRLDGREVHWFGMVHRLRPGTHDIFASMPAGEPCCDAISSQVVIEAAPIDEPETPQIVVLRLPIRAAQATLVAAPPDGYLACDNGFVVRADAAAVLPMNRVQWTGRCHFLPHGATREVTVRAGQTTMVVWNISRLGVHAEVSDRWWPAGEGSMLAG